jgi:hypothetical protein
MLKATNTAMTFMRLSSQPSHNKNSEKKTIVSVPSIRPLGIAIVVNSPRLFAPADLFSRIAAKYIHEAALTK